MHTYIHACMHTYTHTYMHTHMHTYIHTYIHTSYTHIRRVHVYTYIITYTYIHTYLCTYTYTYCIQTYICIYIYICKVWWSCSRATRLICWYPSPWTRDPHPQTSNPKFWATKISNQSPLNPKIKSIPELCRKRAEWVQRGTSKQKGPPPLRAQKRVNSNPWYMCKQDTPKANKTPANPLKSSPAC